MKFKMGFVMGLLFACLICQGQAPLETGDWKVRLLRADGQDIVFQLLLSGTAAKPVINIINGAERLRVDKVRMTKDSVFIQMPVFESFFRLQKLSKGQWKGTWYKESSAGQVQMPVVAYKTEEPRFVSAKQPVANISGRWAITFFRANGTTRPALGQLVQKGNQLTGSILTPTGDYRFLAGVVDGDSLRLSTFDGSHAYYFTAGIKDGNTITGGHYFSGTARDFEPWQAVKDANATLPDLAAMYLKEGESRLNFRFSDLNGKMVSINDARFRNKVVIVQIMGSWCPNCMDETAFLSEYYKKNKQRGVEIIGLAYEYSTDFNRSKASVQKFKDRFDVQYPLLITGVTVSDSLRTEKTLPQLTPIKSFPSTIFIDKKGFVSKIHAGFAGPGTGSHYEALKQEFDKTIDALLKE